MKKLLPIALMTPLFIFFVFNANANVWRVGYYGPATSIDFVDLQTAINKINTGDSIYLYPGTWSGNITKKVTLIGFGYFLNNTTNNNNNGIPNTGLQIIKQDMTVNVTLDNGSNGSTFEGLEGLSISNYEANSFPTPAKIVIDRCEGSVSFYGKGGGAIDGWVITRSWLKIASYSHPGYSNSQPQLTNLTVNNCYLASLDLNTSFNGLQQSGIFINDVFPPANSTHFNYGSFLVENCIFMGGADGDGPQSSVVYYNCLYNTDVDKGSWPAADSAMGNIGNSFSKNQVFTDYPTANNGTSPANNYSPDAGLAIVNGSVAKNAGDDGKDLGIYGGTNPYQLSGVAVPAFYKLTAPGINATTNPYKVTFSVKSHN